ncbi:hypothetical protein [Herbidospora yilanensis]|nr:hypothetical protein [Herbidospora yilanensis]
MRRAASREASDNSGTGAAIPAAGRQKDLHAYLADHLGQIDDQE